MTPAEHYAAAEAQLAQADDVYLSGNTAGALQDGLEALVHAVLAVAGELGVPVTPPSTPVSGPVAGGPASPIPSG